MDVLRLGRLRNSDDDATGGTTRGSKSYVLLTATTVLLPLRTKAPPALFDGDDVVASGRGRVGGASTSSLGNGVCGDSTLVVGGVELKEGPCHEDIKA